MINIYICDASPDDIVKYSRQIYNMKFNTNVKIIPVNDNIEKTLLDSIRNIDIIITDTKIKRLNCINLMKKIRKNGFKREIIYLTDDKESVFDTFETEPVDYILKDQSEKLENVLVNCVNELNDKSSEFIILGNSNKRNKIFKKNILFVESIGRKMIVHENDGSTNECYMNVAEMLSLLGNDAYARIHKSFIINYDHIKKVDNNTIYTKNNIPVPMGKAYVDEIKKVISFAVENNIYST